jgi:hypothetical protein
VEFDFGFAGHGGIVQEVASDERRVARKEKRNRRFQGSCG